MTLNLDKYYVFFSEIKNIALNINIYIDIIYFFSFTGSVRPGSVFEDMEPDPKPVQTGPVRFLIGF